MERDACLMKTAVSRAQKSYLIESMKYSILSKYVVDVYNSM